MLFKIYAHAVTREKKYKKAATSNSTAYNMKHNVVHLMNNYLFEGEKC